MLAAMADVDVRSRLLRAGTDLIRGRGYVATSVSDICGAAGVSKGAFFHHFESKEDLARECLSQWCEMAAGLDASSPHHEMEDPAERLSAYLAFMIEVFSDSTLMKSCLAGTTVQEVHATHPSLRAAAHECFVTAEARLQHLIEAAAPTSGGAAELASVWMATLQGSLVLAKASGDDSCIARSLGHVKSYIEGRVGPES